MNKRRALLSVSDKTGLVALARQLVDLGFDIVSTGGTKTALDQAGIPTIAISDVTAFPEMMDGRLKTLHPSIHGGLLAVRDDVAHQEAMREHGIVPIDLVVVNLYPFVQTIANPQATLADAIENIDIGGPTMLRSAAKNHVAVTVIVDPADYDVLIEQLRHHGDTTLALRQQWAAKVFRYTAAYDAHIATYLGQQWGVDVPERLTMTYEHVQTLRYGENPHQAAALYAEANAPTGSLVQAKQLQGKPLSFNNLQDTSAAWQTLRSLADAPTAVAIKHMNPCGVGRGTTIAEAFRMAYEADPVSIFGGIVALNETVDVATAQQLHSLFLEVVIAPGYEPDALAVLATKKNVRVLQLPLLPRADRWQRLPLEGGLLVQTYDDCADEVDVWQVMTEQRPDVACQAALSFAWNVVKHVKSNAIVIANEQRTLGIGAGQMNRVGSARIALEQAGEAARGAVLASDGFFPMDDTVALAAQYGIRAIIQPGGSVRDADSIAMANRHGIAMIMTQKRHFKH